MDLPFLLVSLCFWGCLAALFYAYAGYPLLLWGLSRWLGRGPNCPGEGLEDLPTLSLLIAAHNEEAVIDERLRNALALDYPRDKLRIVVACDGCSDSTPAIVARYARRGVRLLRYPERRGKAATLNAAFRELDSEVVMLSDANTHTDPRAARKLVRWFRDPEVGVVCGRLILTDPEGGRNADGLYWKYETFLKNCEGRLGALLGANGAIYAIRRELFRPIPADTIVDDLVLPLVVRLRTGCAIIFDREAVAYEETPADVGAEFHRRSRIGAGGFQCLVMLAGLLHPRHGWGAFTFLSHKVLRWLGPFFLVGALTANLLLAGQDFYQMCLLGQLSFYCLALVGAWAPGEVKAVKLLRLTTLFAGMNAALLTGFWRWLRGTQKPAWVPTARLSEAVCTIRPPEVVPAARPQEAYT